MRTISHFIGGALTEGSTLVAHRSPIDVNITYGVPTGDAACVQKAVEAASMALSDWSARTPTDRAALLTKCADWLNERYGNPNQPTELKSRITISMGKPLPEADIEVAEVADFIRFFCDVAPQVLGEETLSLDQNLWGTKRSVVTRQPLGVVAIIKPWNYPLEMIAWSMFPALLAGNTVVIKPSDKSADVAMIFAEMAADVSLPPGILNIVHGDASTGRLLVERDPVRFVSFTGSVRAGKDIARQCADRLIRCSLELGGNDAAIVLADTDVDLAANGLVWGAICNAGQVCVGVKRVYAHRSIIGQLASSITSRIKSLRPMVDVGPIVDQQQYDSVKALVDDAIDRGAQLTVGEGDANPMYFRPTLITNVQAGTRLLTEECFGPVLPLMPFDSDDEAVTLANNSDFGLGASIWTSDHARARVIAGRLQVGMVWVNDVNVAFPQAAWGGLKNSGNSFELGKEAIANYTHPLHFCDDVSEDNRRAWWYPY